MKDTGLNCRIYIFIIVILHAVLIGKKAHQQIKQKFIYAKVKYSVKTCFTGDNFVASLL